MTVRRRRFLGRGDDQGSGTVLLLALVAVTLVVAALLGLLGSAQLGRGRAQTAADLGALAAASRCGRAAGRPVPDRRGGRPPQRSEALVVHGRGSRCGHRASRSAGTSRFRDGVRSGRSAVGPPVTGGP